MSDTKRGQSENSHGRQDKARRGVVKGVALGLGGLTLSQWSKPVVETIVLPAHAQTSPGGGTSDAGSGEGISAAGSGTNTLQF